MSTHPHRAIEARLDEAAQDCARNGVQLTKLRRQVLALVLDSDGPATAYQLLDRLKQTHKGAAPPTVYRALDFLLEQGLVHKLTRINAFIPCAESGHHHHAVQFLICRNCGTVAEIEDQAVDKALAHAAERAGFHPAHAVVELDGTCAACGEAEK
jgi:Fur family transcriptional regulator, zinc uptake regulator